jgi:hypothetical protein
MIVVAHSVTRSFTWLASEVLPALENVKAKCRETNSSGVVIAHLKGMEKTLQEKMPDPNRTQTSAGLGVPAWAAHFQQDPMALRRVLHHLRRNFTGFTPGTLEWCKGERGASRSIRLPQIPGASPAESLNAWISFLATQLDPAVPMLGLLPVGEAWVDVLVGEPTATDFALLRTRSKEAPIVTDIPYEVAPETKADDDRMAASVAQGVLPEFSCLNGQAAAANREVAAKWLVRFRPGSRPGFFSRLFSS